MIVYIDDIIITSDDLIEKDMLRMRLVVEFEIKELEKLKYFISIEATSSEKGISISQHKYIIDLLKETRMVNCKPYETPIDMKYKFDNDEKVAIIDISQYQRLVGKLIYLAYTHPNIAYIVSMVSQFMHNPKDSYPQAVYRLL